MAARLRPSAPGNATIRVASRPQKPKRQEVGTGNAMGELRTVPLCVPSVDRSQQPESSLSPWLQESEPICRGVSTLSPSPVVLRQVGST